MPLYVFRCDECGRVREHLFPVGVRLVVRDCENCNKPMKRMMTAPSFQLKGQGFHSNDYGKTGPKEK